MILGDIQATHNAKAAEWESSVSAGQKEVCGSSGSTDYRVPNDSANLFRDFRMTTADISLRWKSTIVMNCSLLSVLSPAKMPDLLRWRRR